MKGINSIFGMIGNHSYYQENPKLQKIADNAKNQSFDALVQSLKDLCGSARHVEINIYEGNYQVHLFFGLEKERRAVARMLEEKFVTFKLPANSLSTRFDSWQFEDKPPLFCLKLSTNQSVALLGMNPTNSSSYTEAQKTLKETQKEMSRIEQYGLAKMPEEIVHLIFLSFSTLQEIGRGSLLSRAFKVTLGRDFLWQSIASFRKLSLSLLPESVEPLSIKKQVKEALFHTHNAVIALPWSFSGATDLSRGQATQQNIEKELQGFCLTSNLNTENNKFRGIALINDKFPKGNKWSLCIISETNKKPFSEAEYNKIMPTVIQKLHNLQITPDCFVIHEIYFGESKKNFEAWQAKQKKI